MEELPSPMLNPPFLPSGQVHVQKAQLKRGVTQELSVGQFQGTTQV